jgi:hypothetical protein
VRNVILEQVVNARASRIEKAEGNHSPRVAPPFLDCGFPLTRDKHPFLGSATLRTGNFRSLPIRTMRTLGTPSRSSQCSVWAPC